MYLFLIVILHLPSAATPPFPSMPTSTGCRGAGNKAGGWHPHQAASRGEQVTITNYHNN